MPVTIDPATFILSLFGSAGVAALAGHWFAKSLVDHAFAVDLEKRKSELSAALAQTQATLDAQLAESQARLESQLHRSTEALLGEEAAERAYRFEARKRLYTAVGPLRFQLIQAAVQLRSRVRSFRRAAYDVSLAGYFGRSLLFRIGQVLALTELIERQIAYADFAVDPGMVSLLRFRSQIMRALSSGEVSLGHGDEDWTRQKQHIFRDQLPILAVSMITPQEGRPDRVVRFDEFAHLLDTGKGNYLQPLARLVDGFDPTAMPILWLRMLAMAEACGGLLDHEKSAVAIEPPILDPAELLAVSRNAELTRRRDEYLSMLADFRARSAPPIGEPAGSGTGR